MFNYTICYGFSDEYFKRTCKALEERIPNIKKGRFCYDVDGAKAQDYEADGNHICVYNDVMTDVVRVEAEYDIELYLTQR